MNMLKHKDKIAKKQSDYSAMSSKTKGFLQKICYKKTASVDMTQFGFINDSKVYSINFLLKPLKEHFEKICGKQARSASAKSPASSPRRQGEKELSTSRARSKAPLANKKGKSIKNKKINSKIVKPKQTKKTL